MYKSAKELVEYEMPKSVRSQLLPIFLRGISAYKQILNMQGGTFQSIFIHNIRGALLNFMIFRQFEADMLSSSFPFVPMPEKVNSFKYTALNLLHNNVKINVGKSFNSESFPNNSKYRRNFSERNRFPEDDLFYGLDRAYDQLFVNDDPYYTFLTFNLKNDELDYLNLMIPNWNMTRPLFNLNLKNEISLVSVTEEAKVHDEKIITHLKDEFLKNLPLKGEVNE